MFSDETQNLNVWQDFVICLNLEVLEISGLSVVEMDVNEKNYI